MMPGATTDKPFAARWDRRKDYCVEESADHSWIGEDKDGVWMCKHPLTALFEDDALWDIWFDWQHGLREITPADVEERSALELHALLTLGNAQGREEERSMEAHKEASHGGA